MDSDAISGPALCAWNLTVPSFPSGSAGLRLVTSGPTAAAGILLLHNKPICDDGWSMEAANVACMELKYSRALEATRQNQVSTDEFSLDEVVCQGMEVALTNCSHRLTENCDSGEAAGVVCDSADLSDLVRTRSEECYASNVLFGPALGPQAGFQPTVLDCQERCGRTLDCNTFSYDSMARECRLHRVGDVENAGLPTPATPLGREIREIQTKTDGEDRALCVPGDCTVRLRLSEGRSSCETHEFTDLKPRAVDRLNTSSLLGSCFQKSFYGTELTMLVTHADHDGWTGEWVKVLFTDGSTAHCPMGIFLDDDETATLNCIVDLGEGMALSDNHQQHLKPVHLFIRTYLALSYYWG